VTDWLTYVQNILQPSFVGPFDVVWGPEAFAYNAYAIIRPLVTSWTCRLRTLSRNMICLIAYCLTRKA